ncbi:Protein translation factor SUI1-like protein [Zea mays]|uniref:Protein translation factor SUI1-like protein n=1 Tax=Zea mays TaxID=4577 RepID=A0A1D6IDU1_MAIZE|nr:Protein translation factor SUI1-like protein [Zea mays]
MVQWSRTQNLDRSFSSRVIRGRTSRISSSRPAL